MNQKTIILSSVMLLGSITIFAMHNPLNNNTNIKTLNGIPRHYSDLATKLSQEISFTGSGSPYKESKILLLPFWCDCKISEILSANAREITDEVDEHIYAFGRGNNQRYLKHDLWHVSPSNSIGIGIESWIHKNYVTCHSETREVAYKKIIENLRKDWYFANAQNYPTMVHTQPTDTWLLIMKKQNIISEAQLISHLISKLKASDMIYCSDEWFTTQECDEIEQTDTIYLWIKKDTRDTFEIIFDFEIAAQVPSDTIQRIQRQHSTLINTLIQSQNVLPRLACSLALILLCVGGYQCYMFM